MRAGIRECANGAFNFLSYLYSLETGSFWYECCCVIQCYVGGGSGERHWFWCSALEGDEEATGEQSSTVPRGTASAEISEGEVEVAGMDEGQAEAVIA